MSWAQQLACPVAAVFKTRDQVAVTCINAIPRLTDFYQISAYLVCSMRGDRAAA